MIIEFLVMIFEFSFVKWAFVILFLFWKRWRNFNPEAVECYYANDVSSGLRVGSLGKNKSGGQWFVLV